MPRPSEILCPSCHQPGRYGSRNCRHCGHDMTLNNPGPRYYITRVIKAGGQGAVYEAVGDDDKIYAVKEMLEQFSNPQERQEAVARFEHEARMLRQLAHPRIPKIYASFEDEGRHYLAMDFVQGEDLEEILERQGSISEELALRWSAEICDLLDYLHDNGMIYRDIKPSNIMLERGSGHVKLIDFGIAKVLQGSTRGTQIGTPGYAPPEQYQGIATQQSDIYALGATLHHLLTGRDPRDHQPFTFPPARDVQPTISQRTSDALGRALQMRPEDRFASIEELCGALGVGQRQSTPLQPALTAPLTAPPMPQPRRGQQPAPQPQPQQRQPPPPQPQPQQRQLPPAPPPQRGQQPAPQAPPQPARRGACLPRLIALLIVAGLAIFGALQSGALDGLIGPGGPTPTAETLLQQPFSADNIELIVPADTDAEGIRRAFITAYTLAARAQFGDNVRVKEETVEYTLGPDQVGEDGRGIQYRASLTGDVLIPRP